jgi:hypothetical protein
MVTPDTLPPASAADIEPYELAMRELLLAADRGTRLELSEPAMIAVAVAGSLPGRPNSTWPGIYRHAARYLRERCIRLGVPRSRYVGGDWLRLGL